MKNYDFSLEHTNLNVISKVQHLLEEFRFPWYISENTEGDTKIYKISYNVGSFSTTAKENEFFDKLEDLALRYNM